MGDRTQRLKGNANEFAGKAKAEAGYDAGKNGSATGVRTPALADTRVRRCDRRGRHHISVAQTASTTTDRQKASVTRASRRR